MKTLCFGSLNLDIVYRVHKIVKEGETISSISKCIFVGGKGLNQSIAMSRAGASITHAGIIGKDGYRLLEKLKENNVDISLIKIDENKDSGQAIIQVDDNGNNCILLSHGTNYSITKDYINEVLSNFGKGDFIVLQNEISNIKYLISRAYEKGINIVLNPSPYEESIVTEDILSKTAYLILNEREAFGIGKTNDIKSNLSRLSNKYPKMNIVLTLGEKGVIFSNKDNYIDMKAKKVKAIDTTGAGDTFLGYFVASIIKGEDYNNALSVATKASAICVTRNGAADSIPFIEEI